MCLMHLVMAAWLHTGRVRGTPPAVTSLLMYTFLPAISFSILFQMIVVARPAAQSSLCVYRCLCVTSCDYIGNREDLTVQNKAFMLF